MHAIGKKKKKKKQISRNYFLIFSLAWTHPSSEKFWFHFRNCSDLETSVLSEGWCATSVPGSESPTRRRAEVRRCLETQIGTSRDLNQARARLVLSATARFLLGLRAASSKTSMEPKEPGTGWGVGLSWAHPRLRPRSQPCAPCTRTPPAQLTCKSSTIHVLEQVLQLRGLWTKRKNVRVAQIQWSSIISTGAMHGTGPTAWHRHPRRLRVMQEVTPAGHETWKSHWCCTCVSAVRRAWANLWQGIHTYLCSNPKTPWYWVAVPLLAWMEFELRAVSLPLPFHSSTSVGRCQSKISSK